MKAKQSALPIVGFACFATIGLYAQAATAAKAPAGTWVLLGTTEAKHTSDNDTLRVTDPGAYRQVKIGVNGASLHMKRFVVTYDNGLKDDIPVNYKIPKDSETRPLQLHGKHRITQVDYQYDTKGWLHGSAKVSLYAKR
jgi:hypothetical protein